MSYGTSAVIIQPKNKKDKIPFIFIGGFYGMNWHLYEKNVRKIQKLNNQCKKYIKEEPDGISTLEKLKTAPMDEVIVITGESSYESMKDRKPRK